MRCLVTGGAGFLGSHLVDALIDAGEDVIVLDNFYRGRAENLRRHSESRRCRILARDIRIPSCLQEALDGVEVVYHLAAQSNVLGSLSDAGYSFSTNVTGSFNVLQAAAEAGVRRLVFASSREVYGEPRRLPVSEDDPTDPRNPYGASKIAGEAYCRAWQNSLGLDSIVLRFANIYGPRDFERVIPRWIERARAGWDIQLYGGSQLLDFVPVATAVEALLAAAVCETTGPVNVASGRGVRLVDLAQHILALIGSRSRLSTLPARNEEVEHFVADVTRMREVLRVSPPADPLSALDDLCLLMS